MSGLDITLLRPFWLAAPPVIALVAFAWRARGSLGDWRRAVDPHLLAALERRGGVVAAKFAGFPLWLLAAGIIGAALTGPAVERRTAETFRNLDGLAILIDTSRSMTDGGGSADARLAAMQAVEAAGSRQAMLVLYAGDAYPAAAFTGDRGVLRPLIMGETTGVVPDNGSNPTRALALARRSFAQVHMLGGDIVVVTDGGGIVETTLAQAAALRGEGRHVHVVYAPAPHPSDAAPLPDLNAAAELARAGGGRLVTGSDASAVADAIRESPARRTGQADYVALAWTDYGRYALILAMPALLLLFRRRA
jgi:Ca-activated chloride channel family protein